jgi:hypothetical protein
VIELVTHILDREESPDKVKTAHLEKGAPPRFTGLPIQFIWVALFAAKAPKGQWSQPCLPDLTNFE